MAAKLTLFCRVLRRNSLLGDLHVVDLRHEALDVLLVLVPLLSDALLLRLLQPHVPLLEPLKLALRRSQALLRLLQRELLLTQLLRQLG